MVDRRLKASLAEVKRAELVSDVACPSFLERSEGLNTLSIRNLVSSDPYSNLGLAHLKPVSALPVHESLTTPDPTPKLDRLDGRLWLSGD